MPPKRNGCGDAAIIVTDSNPETTSEESTQALPVNLIDELCSTNSNNVHTVVGTEGFDISKVSNVQLPVVKSNRRRLHIDSILNVNLGSRVYDEGQSSDEEVLALSHSYIWMRLLNVFAFNNCSMMLMRV